MATIVTFEPTGNWSVRRFGGLFVSSSIGLGFGDMNANGGLTAADIGSSPGSFEDVLYSQNTQFNAAADVDGNGRIDNLDLFVLRPELVALGANPATLAEYDAVLLRRGDMDGSNTTDADDVSTLFANFDSSDWLFDLNVDGTADESDVVLLVEQILDWKFGDLNGDGMVNLGDAAPLVLALVNRTQFDLDFQGVEADVVGDIDLSGSFDMGDIAAFSNLFSVPPSAASVPEPTTFAFMFAGALTGTLFIRRHPCS